MFQDQKNSTTTSSTTTKKRKPSFCKHCNAVVLWLDDPAGGVNAYGKPKRLPYLVNAATGQSTGEVHRCKIGYEKWKEQLAIQQQKEKEAGRTVVKPCSHGCGKMVYRSYTRLSQIRKPLPIEEGTDELHMCPNWTGSEVGK